MAFLPTSVSAACAVINRAFQLGNVCWSGIHQGKEAGHGVLADQRFCRLCFFGLGHLTEGYTAIGEDII